jgi:Protein of unknown function (DUF3105)
VAKKDKNTERNERRERMERMRREAARAERRRSLIVVAVCVLIAVVIASLTGWKLLQDRQDEQETAGTDLDAIGVSADAAGCQEVVTKPVELELQKDGTFHVPQGTRVDYSDSPPAFGLHWPEPAEYGRKFYTTDDRPDLEQLVHNEEHGYTILWYDQTVADDAEQLQVVKDIAATFDVGQSNDLKTYNESKFIAAPWTADDGAAFPDGAHIAFTRWALEGDDAVQDKGEGAWQYCEQPSGEALAAFREEFPESNSPEPNGV